MFDEASEKALEKACEHPEVQKAMRDMTKAMLEYLPLIIEAALEEKKKQESTSGDDSE